MKDRLERRYYATEFEVRSEGNSHVIEGYAARFNTFSEDLGGFVEDISQGTFKKTIQEADIRCLRDHMPNLILGRNKAGTLTLYEDSDGLGYRNILPDTSYARDLRESMERKDVTQSSFGFVKIKDKWGKTERSYPRRTLLEVRLLDVSPVTYPAYTDTSSGMRSLELFAEERGLPIGELRAHLGEVIDGNYEPEPEQRNETTPILLPFTSLPPITLTAKLNQLKNAGR